MARRAKQRPDQIRGRVPPQREKPIASADFLGTLYSPPFPSAWEKEGQMQQTNKQKHPV